jgi:YVTN family beta-propeller protein
MSIRVLAIAYLTIQASSFAAGSEPAPANALQQGELLPTGARVTATAAEGALFQPLNPDLPSRPDFVVGQAVTTATSPDGATLLILTSGYNRNNGADGRRVAAESQEYVFVYDISVSPAVKRQVLPVPNTFSGLAWNPSGLEFYASGGVDDAVHVFQRGASGWSLAASISLGHGTAGLGLGVRPLAAGLAVSPSGRLGLVTNFENDSVSLLDFVGRTVVAELDLRPGVSNPSAQGQPGGGYPYWVTFKGEDKAYVSSQRDDEVVVLGLLPAPAVQARIHVGRQPNRMILDRQQRRLFVANGSSDTVSVIDTRRDRVVETFGVTAPRSVFHNSRGFTGANPNSLALSPDERTLYVTDGGTNAIAVVRLRREHDDKPARRDGDDDDDDDDDGARVVGLIPTGWYPNSISLSADGSRLHVVNGKSNAGPNPGACRDTLSVAPGSSAPCSARNAYVWQLTKAGYLSLPLPSPVQLARLTLQVAVNNRFIAEHDVRADGLMAQLRQRIKHVIYIVKENRTYDQVLGDLEVGDGDPSLNLFPEPLTPNHHALARGFVTLDRFFDSGEVSGDGWNWTTAGRTTDFTEKTVPVNYGGRGLSYDWEGTNRNINVALATVAERKAADPLTPDDPNLMPGTVDVAAPPAASGAAGTGYLWDAALRKGLTLRNYGFYGDGVRYSIPTSNPAYVPIVRNPFEQGIVQFFPAKAALSTTSDPYFRTFDMKNDDFWLFKEWEREFDQYVQAGRLPALELVRLPHDHFGDFGAALDGVNTPDTQMADNDYAIGLLAEKIAHSPFRDDTVIFIVEDDAQNGGDHVDAHRSIAYVIGAFVKQGAVVSTSYSTVSVVRTIEELLGVSPSGLTDGLAAPMSDVFEMDRHHPRPWSYNAIVPEVLRTTTLPLPAPLQGASAAIHDQAPFAQPRHDAAWWAAAMAGQDFTREDALDEARFNAALWRGLMGEAREAVR